MGKKKSIRILLTIMTLLVFLSSCVTTRKTKSSQKEMYRQQVESQNRQETGSSKDSIGIRYEHNTDSTGVVVEFEPEVPDTFNYGYTVPESIIKKSNQVVIKPDGTIEAKGKIKTVSVNKKLTRSAVDSTHTVIRDTSTIDEHSAGKTEILKEEKTKQVKRSTSWGLVVLGIGAGLIVGLYIDYRTGGNVLWWIMGLFRRRKSSNDRVG